MADPRRVLVSLEADELAAVEARWPDLSRSAAVREAVRRGLSQEQLPAPPQVSAKVHSPDRPAPAATPSPPPVPGVGPATERVRRHFVAAGEGLEALRELVAAGDAAAVRETVGRVRQHLTALLAQLRRESEQGILGDWRRRREASEHTGLVEGVPAPGPAAPAYSAAAMCWEALAALRGAAEGIEAGAYDGPISRHLPAVREQLRRLLKELGPPRRRPDAATAREVLRRRGPGLVSPGAYEGWWIDAEQLEELAAAGDLVREPWEEGGGADYRWPEPA